MSLLLLILALLTAAIGQVVLSGVWPAMAGFFDLPLVAVIYCGIKKGPAGALLAGAGVGLFQDALEGTLLGVNALSKALVGYLVGVLGLRFALAPLMSRVLVLAASTVLSRVTEVGILAIMGRRLAYAPYPHLLMTMTGNCLVGSLLVGLFAARGLKGEAMQ
jgi:rod shape-determining protein MreD